MKLIGIVTKVLIGCLSLRDTGYKACSEGVKRLTESLNSVATLQSNMKFDPKDFFVEKEASDVEGFVIIDSDEGGAGYRMAEKWEQEEKTQWITYWLPEERLQERLSEERCAHSKTITDTQFEGVLNLAGVLEQHKESTKAAA